MPIYEYVALDAGGRNRKGMVDADDPRLARQKLRGQGLFPTMLREAAAGARPGGEVQEVAGAGALGRVSGLLKGVGNISLRPMSRAELAANTRQIATLLSAGLPLDQVLAGMLGQQSARKGAYAVLAQVRERIKEGKSLAQALREHPRVFNATYVTMVEAGEQSGTLELIMQRLADFSEQELALRRKVLAALAYPVLMGVTGVGIVLFLLAYVVPRITEIFVDMQRALPLPTVILIGVSDLFRRYWLVVLLLPLVAWMGLRWWGKRPAGRRKLDAWRLSMPFVGRLRQAVTFARLSRTLGTLLAGGVPLLSALAIVSNVVDNVVLREAIQSIAKEVSEGAGLAASMGARQLFPSTMLQLVAAGEQSGSLDSMFVKIAEMFEGELDSRLAVVTSLLEPVMILALGALVGFVVLAVLLPIFEMSSLVR